MSSIVISGDTSGAITVSAPAIAGSNTLTLQAATATSAVNKLETAVTCAGQTSIEFTGLPSWIKRITVLIQGVSTSGTSNIQVQIGSTTFTTSGYSCFVASIDGTNSTSVSAPATGFLAKVGVALANTYTGTMVLNLTTGNTWLSTGSTSSNAGPTTFSNGFLSLGGTLDRVRLTTTGADTFDTNPSAGTVNILYEG
jgi:hypothetical protein